jgi:hypothetical protein
VVKNENKKITIALLSLIIGITIFFITNIAGNVIPTTLLQTFFLSMTSFLLVIICWFCVTLLIWIVRKYNRINLSEEDKKESLRTAGINDFKPCKICNNICCLDALLKNPDMNIQISKAEIVINNLFYPIKITEIEAQGDWKNIWIFSEDLYTEVVNQTDGLELVVVENIKKRKITYTEFYFDKDTEHHNIEDRKKNMLDSLGTDDQNKLIFVPLKHDKSYIGKNILPLFCGSILFSSKFEKDGTPYFKEGYLSMRKDRKEKQIYYKMPRCMLREYAEFFKEKMNKGDKK